jgi:4-hydroxybenzoate polyprenyltransferase
MDKLTAEIIALLLLFAAFPLTSFGATGGYTLVWCLGLACLVIGGLLPIITRFMDHSGDKIRDAGMEFDERTS